MLLRANGPVLMVGAREGISTRTGKAWRIPYVTVLIENQGVAEINVSDAVEATMSPGVVVDWLVDVVASGGFLSVKRVREVGNAPMTPAVYAVDSAS